MHNVWVKVGDAVNHKPDPELYFSTASQKKDICSCHSQSCRTPRDSVKVILSGVYRRCQPSVQCVVVLLDDQRLAEQCASVRGFVVSSSDHETILRFKVWKPFARVCFSCLSGTRTDCVLTLQITHVFPLLFLRCCVLCWSETPPKRKPDYSSEEGDTKPQHRTTNRGASL